MNLPFLPQDKANHFIYGTVLAVLAAGLAVAFGYREFAGCAALGTSSWAGVAKEAHDAWVNYKTTGNWKTGPHGVEGYDFLATALGGLSLFLFL
jgi:hypothetical protein